MICGERAVSYRDLPDGAGRIAAALRSSGVRRGDRVGSELLEHRRPLRLRGVYAEIERRRLVQRAREHSVVYLDRDDPLIDRAPRIDGCHAQIIPGLFRRLSELGACDP